MPPKCSVCGKHYWTDNPCDCEAKASGQSKRKQVACPAECDDGVDWSSGSAETCKECEGSGTLYVTQQPDESSQIEQLLCVVDDCRSLIKAGLQRDALFSIDAVNQLLIALRKSPKQESSKAPRTITQNDGLDYRKMYENLLNEYHKVVCAPKQKIIDAGTILEEHIAEQVNRYSDSIERHAVFTLDKPER